MASLERVLFRSPWVPYNSQFVRSRLTLAYPENVVFAAQLLKHLSQLGVYRDYPYAERFDDGDLERVDWRSALIILDRDLRLVFAPDPVYRLVQLDRRLHYREAAAALFAPFRFLPAIEVFRRQWAGILALLLLYYSVSWLASRRGSDHAWVLPSRTEGPPAGPGP